MYCDCVCFGADDLNALLTRLLYARREHVLRTEHLSLRCNDLTCGWTTNLLPVRRSSAIMSAQKGGSAMELNEAPCPAVGCRGGRLKPQATAVGLNTQLWYLSWLFDLQRAAKREAAAFYSQRGTNFRDTDPDHRRSTCIV